MKKQRFTETQIVSILKQYEGGRDPMDLVREYGVSKATLYNWRKKYAGMDAAHLKEMKSLQDENRRLKQMYAELMLDHQLAKTIIEKKLERPAISVCSQDSCAAGPIPTGITMCNNYTTVVPTMAVNAVPDNPCSDSTSYAASQATNVYTIYRDSLQGSFEANYLGLALQAAKTESLTMRQKVSEYHYTLYYYDQAGNLEKTVPPQGVVRNYTSSYLTSVRAARKAGTTVAFGHSMESKYRFNSLNAAVAQKTPDAGVTNFWYDRLGRMALSQNAKQLAEGTNYSYTLYDAIGRTTDVGQINTGAGVVSTNTTKVPVQLQTWLGNNISNRYQITQTVYDLSAGAGIASWLIQNPFTLRNRVSYTSHTPGQTGSTTIFQTYYNYDILGNVNALLQDYGASSPMGTSGQQYKRIDYQYDLISGKVNSVAYQRGKPDAFLHFLDISVHSLPLISEHSLPAFQSKVYHFGWTYFGYFSAKFTSLLPFRADITA